MPQQHQRKQRGLTMATAESTGPRCFLEVQEGMRHATHEFTPWWGQYLHPRDIQV